MQNVDEALSLGKSFGEELWPDLYKVCPQKTVLKVDVNCTPSSALDELLRQLEEPCMPTFKLKDLVSLCCFQGSICIGQEILRY